LHDICLLVVIQVKETLFYQSFSFDNIECLICGFLKSFAPKASTNIKIEEEDKE
jgi:hypothetical protein